MSMLPMPGYDPNRRYTPQGYPQQPFGGEAPEEVMGANEAQQRQASGQMIPQSPMTMPTGNPTQNVQQPQQAQAVQQGLLGRNAQYGDAIGKMYQSQLGRSASTAEIQNRLNDPNFNITRHMGDIARSQEAQNYRNSQAQTAAQPAAAPPTAAAPPQAAGGLGQYAGKLEGFDQGKLTSGHDSPKYQFGRTFSQFNPQGGISQGLLDSLNKLGLGNVTGQIGGDKISIANADPRFNGVTEFDIIRDLESGGGWQWGGIGGAGFDGGGGGGGGGGQAGAVSNALGGGGGGIGAMGTGGHPAYTPTHAGGAPYGASEWLKQLLGSLGVG